MNILSVINAGKRTHGENHWFWAIWIGVENTPDLTPEADRQYRPYSTWNKQQPSSSGYCASKKFAKRAAWEAIRSLTSQWPSAYFRSWAWQMIYHHDEKEKLPSFSRCKIGPDKWFWIVKNDRFEWDSEPVAIGISATAELARMEAESRVGKVDWLGNSMVESFRKKQAAMKRSQKRTDTSNTATVEFVYECHSFDSDYDNSTHASIEPHRIVKKTKKRIYVESDAYREGSNLSGDWRDFVSDTFVLDRVEFERNGKAKRSGRRWYNTYYADPAIYFAERRSMAFVPECFARLGLPAGATAEEIQSAYRRLACKTHPDAGGTAEDFKKVQAWYEQALASIA